MSNSQLLDVLTREGVLINATVRYWRAAKKLKPEDLGLRADDVTDRLISLGHKKLLPREALARFALIESRVHALVDAGTYPFLNGLGHYLPNAKLDEVTTKLRQMETAFAAAQEEFLRQYSGLRMSAIHEWEDTARKLVEDPDRLVATIEASFPPPDQLKRHFAFDVQLFQITAPERMQMDLIAVGDQREIAQARSRAAQEATVKIQQDVEQFAVDAVATLREETAKLCEEMLQSMDEGKTGIHQKTLNRLVEFIDSFKQMNVFNDQELESRLHEVREKFLQRTAEEYRDDAFARQQLQQGLRRLGDKAKELAAQDAKEIVQRFGQMGVRKFHMAA